MPSYSLSERLTAFLCHGESCVTRGSSTRCCNDNLPFPVTVPLGTATVTCAADLVKLVAATLPKITVLVCAIPLVAEAYGSTVKILLLTRDPEGVATVTYPVVAVAGTTAVM